LVLGNDAAILYKVDAYYNKDSEGGIRFDDPQLGIDWKISKSELIISEKDMQLPFFHELNNYF